ncbi:MAG TPA: hypothetical protein VFQ38_15475 [Longimicrobiales bacterium]|nr:hypothetical protein [Longimicrobiales bacterium]
MPLPLHRLLAIAFAAGLAGIAAIPASATAQRLTQASLRAMAANLLPQAEKLSGLKARRPIHVAVRTRKQLHAELVALAAADSSPDRNASAVVLQRLGLMKDTANLLDWSIDLTTEELAGYYDPKRDTLYVLSDVPHEGIRAVVLHEIVHALQDQYVPLDSLHATGRGNGDRALAVRAAIEGQATLAMFLYQVRELGIARPGSDPLPDLSAIPRDLLIPPAIEPLMAAAPRIVRDEAAFPYMSGAGFVQLLQRKHPGAFPFGDNLPVSTEQVLDPERALLDRRDDPTEIHLGPRAATKETGVGGASRGGEGGAATRADAATGRDATGGTAAAGPWKVRVEDTFGQFALTIFLLERYSLQSASLARGWDGDRYQLLADGSHNVLVWYILWDSPAAARRFADAYRQILHTRLGRSGSVEQLEVDGRSVVRIVDAEEGADISTLPRPEIRLERTAR